MKQIIDVSTEQIVTFCRDVLAGKYSMKQTSHNFFVFTSSYDKYLWDSAIVECVDNHNFKFKFSSFSYNSTTKSNDVVVSKIINWKFVQDSDFIDLNASSTDATVAFFAKKSIQHKLASSIPSLPVVYA